jgi:hypothetical protein
MAGLERKAVAWLLGLEAVVVAFPIREFHLM